MKILIVEDDKILNNTLALNIEMEGYEVCSKYNFSSAEKELFINDYDLVLLDINLPDGNGLELCKKMKSRNISFKAIFLTANDLEEDMIEGYKVGGMDYITKPFSIKVLIYKLKAILGSEEVKNKYEEHYFDGLLKIDFKMQYAEINSKLINFTPKEYQILKLFTDNPGIILTKRILLEKLWDIDGNYVDEHTLVTAISRIRRKIEVKDFDYIKTVYGMGYKWMGENKNENI